MKMMTSLPPVRPDPAARRTDRLTSTLSAPGAWTTLEAHRSRFAPPPMPGRDEHDTLIAAVERAGLRGRGGASFPLGMKLRAVAGARRKPIVVANGSEGEPLSGKDAMLMSRAPHLVLDGALAAAAAVNADQVIVAIKTGAGHAHEAVSRALRERYTKEPWGPRVRIVDVPPLYLAGEERALVNLINHGRAIPPPGQARPFQRGVAGRPTLVSNIETLAHLAMIRQHGPEWFREVGHPDGPGTMFVSLSGAIGRPGIYEVATGQPVRELVNAAGGTTQETAAVLVGGYAGTWLTTDDVGRATLDPLGMATVAGIVGCGVVVVLPRSACGIRETSRVMRWLSEQTAGQCGPCVFGLGAIAEAMDGLSRGASRGDVTTRLARWAGDVHGRGACRYPDGAVRFMRSALGTFASDARAHANGHPCPWGDTPAILPVPDVRSAA